MTAPRDALVVGVGTGAGEALREAGAHVRETESGREALAVMGAIDRRWCPDLVVVAADLPDDAIAFVHALRSDWHTCTTTVAVVVRSAADRAALEAAVGGRTAVVPAPFSLAALGRASGAFSLSSRADETVA